MATVPTDNAAALDIAAIRADFPALQQQVHGRALVYLDSAATSQKPTAVIEALGAYYRHDNANVHRGIHTLSERATAGYEGARRKIAEFINAGDPRQIVFTRGTTESINLVASSWGRANLRPGDEVLITHMEHHSNIVPWQIIAEATGASVSVVPVNDRGELDVEAFAEMLSERTQLVSLVHVSNALGTINPIADLVKLAKQAGAVVLVDGAQATMHMPVDVQAIGCDFYAFSGHKCFGPTGIGVLFGRYDLLESMRPYQGGGEMIEAVSFAGTRYAAPPTRFEAGTPHIAGAIGLGAAIDYMNGLEFAAVAAHEADLLDYGTKCLSQIDGLRLIGTAADKVAVFSFVVDGMHPYDLAPLLDRAGVAVRTGHHCTQPLMERFDVPATVRASLAVYNTREDIDALVAGLEKARRFFG